MTLKQLISRFLDLIYPPKCTFCQTFLPNYDVGYCETCQKDLPWLTDSAQALQSGEFFTTCVAPLRYEDPVRESFHNYKFRGQRCFSLTYSQLMAQAIHDHLNQDFDLITWAPIHRKRKGKRGYDQSLLLAKPLSRQLKKPLVSTLKKLRNNPAQSTLGTDASVRRGNVLGCYICKKPSAVVGKKILLVDDIHTTGSTLSECTRVLLTAGALEVHCVTLAHANAKIFSQNS